ncbi:MAG TPA: hypothetical protein VHB45_07010 [Alloacidobacterium sp.]|nr:hypothetical protein [Alloacidobacterium sp.]
MAPEWKIIWNLLRLFWCWAIVEVLALKEYLRHFLRERNAFIKQVAESESWRKYLSD